MDEMQIFESKEFGQIRTVEIDGEPYFVGKDVANVLGYADTKNALKAHVDEEDKRGWQITTPGGEQSMTTINESGLYSLILSSKLPTAKKFKRWITSEVLPAIRKHGAYMTPETLEEAILNPDYLLRVVSALKSETDKRKALEATNASLSVDLEIARPKAEYFDELVDRNTLTNFRETAKQLGVPPKKFVDFLLDHKYIYRDKRGKLMPYEMKNKGLFEIKECFNEKSRWSGTQTLITPKGRETIKQLMIS
nr:MAG TPA: repressor domain protein [Caudoviricetes sp.]